MHISDIIFTSASLVHRFSSRFPSLLSRIFNVHFLPFSFVLSMFRFIIYVSSLLQVHRFCLPPPKMVFFSFFFISLHFSPISFSRDPSDRARASDVPIEL